MVAIYYRVNSELQTTVRYIVMFCFKKKEGKKEIGKKGERGRREGGEERRGGKKGMKGRREGGRNKGKKISLKVYFPM